MLTVDEVLQVIVREIRPIEPRPVPLAAARGAVLADNLDLDEDTPRFDRSQLDGYAVHAADCHPGAALRLLGQIDAGGSLFSGVLEPGECVAINTGGVVPAGADAILMVEHSTIAGNTVTANASLKTGYGIQRRGADARAGDILLTAGTVLGPAQLAVAAAAGVAAPRVRKPRIAILTTGDELIDDLSQPLPPGKIRNSNRPMLVALAAATGADVLDLGACRDESAPLRAILQRALAEADLLLVSGGMSMGTRDLVPPMLKELGVSLHVEKVRIKPGKPFILGSATINGCPAYVAGLPGNPVSGFVTFQRFVLPMLARMRATPLPQLQQAALSIPLPANGDREFYQPCILSRQPDGSLRAELLKWKGSADLFTLGRANGLLVQRPDDPGLPINAAAPVLPF